jgi:Zn-dependent peptidase ImmA (M78 family)/transcriptional regulator with XRE-family HTH domain
MIKQKKFNGERLKSARMYKGYTLTELSKIADISKQSLSLYENGNNKPEWDNISRLSAILKFPRDFFLQESDFKISTDVTYFRALTSATKKDRASQRIKLEYLSQIYSILFDYIDFPHLNIPNIDFSSADFTGDFETDEELKGIEEIAERVREHWKLGYGPIIDLRYVLESNGMIVTSFVVSAEKIDAFSQRTIVNKGEVYMIAIAESGQTTARARFDMAHELGHILLHPWSEDLELISKEEFRARERQANIFAGAFLMPEKTFRQDASPYPTTLDYYVHLKKKWNVSIAAMIYRTYQLKIISNNQFQYLMRQVSKNRWRQNEPLDTEYKLQNNILQSAVDILMENNVLSGKQLIVELAQKGISMYPEQIENLLCLKPGTLSSDDEDKSQIIQLKDYIND